MKQVETEKEFLRTIQVYERVIYKVCTFYISEELPLQDLYQEVIYNLWKGYPKFRNECAVSTWIYRITLNTCISGLRKESRMPKAHIQSEKLQETLPESDHPDIEESIREMYTLINQLKTMEKAIVLLYLEDKSYQEIADITGLAISNVATKLKRSKEKLREMSNAKK